MLALALATALSSSPAAIGQVIPSAAPARYVRLTMKVRLYGVDGTATMAIDRQTARYAERLNAGPASFSQRFDDDALGAQHARRERRAAQPAVSRSRRRFRGWAAGTPATPFEYDSRHPQVDGAIDTFPGAMTIDTGNSGVLDVNSPFAHRYDLWAFYHAVKPRNGSLAGVGGAVATSDVTVQSFRMGTAMLSNVQEDLSQAAAGVESDPAVAANVGEGVFRNFTLLLDYPNQRIYFAPGGLRDALGILFAGRGDRIVVTKVLSGRARRAGVREGTTLTSVDGKAVRAGDLPALEAAFEAPFGKLVHLVFDGKTSVTQMLVPYL